jgi:hypothetical protein
MLIDVCLLMLIYCFSSAHWHIGGLARRCLVANLFTRLLSSSVATFADRVEIDLLSTAVRRTIVRSPFVAAAGERVIFGFCAQFLSVTCNRGTTPFDSDIFF